MENALLFMKVTCQIDRCTGTGDYCRARFREKLRGGRQIAAAAFAASLYYASLPSPRLSAVSWSSKASSKACFDQRDPRALNEVEINHLERDPFFAAVRAR
jgi:hypothetical protein